ncbi:MAG: hypothetical protein ACRDBG_26635 [Waterburya sp.]
MNLRLINLVSIGKEIKGDRDDPDFGSAAVEEWCIDGIPTSIVGIQVDSDRSFALVYYAGIPYKVLTLKSRSFLMNAKYRMQLSFLSLIAIAFLVSAFSY